MDINLVLNVAALVAIVVAAGVGIHYRGTLEAVKNAGGAWKEERDAEKAKSDRLERDNGELRVQLAAAEARTNLEPMMVEIKDLVGAVHQLAESSTQRHSAFASNLEATSKLTAGLVAEMRESTNVLRRIVARLDLINGGPT